MQPHRAPSSSAARENLLAGGFERLPLDGLMPAHNPTDFLDPDHVFDYPSLGIRFRLREGLVRDLIRHYELQRLLIRQLQFLHAIPVREDLDEKTVGKGPHTFPHSRLLHSIIAAYLMAEMATQNGLDLPTSNLLVTIGLMHDAATIAGGDAFKPFHLELFDEEAGLAKFLKDRRLAWQSITSTHPFHPDALEVILDAVKGEKKSPWVSWLDIADILSYLCLDTLELRASVNRGEWKERASMVHGDVFDLMDRGDPLTLWKSVVVHGTQAVIKDKDRLLCMLLIRAWMWRSLYNHPEHRWLEHAVAELMGTYLFSQKIISTGDLLRWTDTDLHRKVQGILRMKSACSSILLFRGVPRSQGFTSLEEAWRVHERLANQGVFTLLIDTDAHRAYIPVSSKTKKYFVLDATGQPVTFEQAHPADSIAVRHAAALRSHPRFVLYFIHDPKLRPDAAAWKAQRLIRHRWKRQLAQIA